MVMRVITAVQLTRLTMAFGAVADVFFVILYTRSRPDYDQLHVAQMDLGLALLVGAVVAVGLFAFGASLNDVLDARHDSTFSPDRPIPAGRIRLGQAIVVTVGALMIALLGGWGLGEGAFLLTLLTAAGILFYNATGKYIPAVGVITIGLIHAAHILIPNYQLKFMWPVWLVMTHAMGIAIAVHLLENKRPRFGRRVLLSVGVGWCVWSALVLGLGAWRADGRLWPEDVPAFGPLWPALAVIAFIVVARWKAGAVPPRSAAEKLKRYGAMWQALYGASWLLATGLLTQAVWLGAFALTGFLIMTIIREITGLTGRPITYRG